MDYDDSAVGSLPLSMYLFLAAASATILLRTETARMPNALDIVVALLFGVLALGVAKVLAYTFGDMLYEAISQIGEASMRYRHTAALNSTNFGEDVEQTPSASMPESNGVDEKGLFMINGRGVRLDSDERRALGSAVATARDSGELSNIPPGLHAKLIQARALTEDGTLTEEGASALGLHD